MAISCDCKSNSNSSILHATFFLTILLFSTKAYCDDHPHASKGSNCLESERIALLAIKSDLYNSDHWLSSWSGFDCCNWRGIACDNTTGHVILLDVHYPPHIYVSSYPDKTYASYYGKSKVNPSLFELKHLKYLDLSFNNFSTQMPTMISSLVHLEHLDLSNANFNGLIPQQLGNLSNLSFLKLSCCFRHPGILRYSSQLWSNDLSWLSHLTSLEFLDMSCVNLSTTTNWPQDAIQAYTNNLSRNQIEENIAVNVTSKLKHLALAGNSLTKFPLNMRSLFHLEHLDLSGNYITNVIFLSMANLSSLEYLDLSYNHITGEIPLSMGNLSSLFSLDVSHNEFYGLIPDILGNLVNLEALYLSYNNFSGQIPENIGRLHKLWYFEASQNNLMGHIPMSLGDLCNLKVLDLSGNNIGGELTNLLDGLSKCPQGSKLQSFIIYDNKFSGSIPFSLGQLSQLKFLYISWNSLHDNMTDAHFSQLTNLLRLDTSYNSLNLILSDDWLPPFHAKMIDMSYCHLKTKFPSWIQTQTTLEDLSLSGVGLYGNIPDWFSDFIFNNSQLHLDISSNNLNGQLPSSISISMDLSNNSFEGRIPLSYANFEHVAELKLSNNYIHSSLPAFFCNFTRLELLHLSNNYLSGEVPNCNGSYSSSLHSLHMNDNNLSGPFPSVLRNCHELVTLDLGGNKFSGEIPDWVGRSFPFLKFLRLSSNSFHGAIPMSIGNLALLQILDLSSNNLIGSIPSTIANFSSMGVRQNYTDLLRFSYQFSYPQAYLPREVEYEFRDNILITAKGSTNEYTKALSAVASIDLSNNELSGEIPKGITKLHGLYFLNLSNNHLTARIPENIGVMSELESLDLSMNRLTGEIPFSLSALNFLGSLNLSYNNLSGRIPTGGQLSTFNDSTYVGNEGLCGVPLPACPSDESNHHSPSQEEDDEDDEKLERVLDYAFIVVGFIIGFWAYLGVIFMKKSTRITLFRMVDKMYDWMYVQLRLKIIAKLNMKWQK